MKTSKKSDSLSYPSLAESWREDFVKLIPRSKRRNELIKYIELIEWEKIGKLAIAEIKTVMRKIGIPQINESIKLNTAIVEAIILSNIKRRLHYLILHHISNINRNDSKSVKNRKIKNILSRIESEIKYSRMIYEMIINFSGLKWIKDTDKIKSEAEKLQKLAEKGGLFSRGKQNRPDEIPHFEAIEKNYSKLKGTKLEKSYRSLAIYVARHDLELEHEKEHINFYNRFLIWHKKHPKKIIRFT